MKKLLIVLALAAILTTGTAFADHPDGWGIGIFGVIDETSRSDVVLSVHIPRVPVFWAVKAGGFDGNPSLIFTGDFYLLDRVLVNGWLHGYFGLGGYSCIGFGDTFGLSAGGRFPVGLSFQPVSLLEFFVEVSPSIGFGILPDPVSLHWGIGGDLGIRFWF